MSQMITEKVYPIELGWVAKMSVSYVCALLIIGVLFMAGIYDIRLIIALLVGIWSFLFFVLLPRPNFHYALEEKYLTVKQGVIRKQEKHVPYGVIQNLFVEQDLLDRVFDLASLVIEDASKDGKSKSREFFSLTLNQNRRKNRMKIGFMENKIRIPGLTPENAGLLKSAILEKMKENPMEETHSGL